MHERIARARRACLRGVLAVVRIWARYRAQVCGRRELQRALDACAVSATGLRAPTRPQALRRAREAA